MSSRTVPERVLSLLFGVVFLTAAQGQALGLRHCSLHDPVPETENGPASPHANPAASGSHLGSASGPAPSGVRMAHGTDAQDGHHDGRPGGCMDDCHVPSEASVSHEWGAASSPPVHARTGPVDGRSEFDGPRHLPFELHLPNAPPTLI